MWESAARRAHGLYTLRTASGRGLFLRPREELVERRTEGLVPHGQVVLDLRRLLRAIYPAFRSLFPKRVIRADALARAMVDVAISDTSERQSSVFENRDIRGWWPDRSERSRRSRIGGVHRGVGPLQERWRTGEEPRRNHAVENHAAERGTRHERPNRITP